jgi:hypothetical protein
MGLKNFYMEVLIIWLSLFMPDAQPILNVMGGDDG